jgi:hypothetical protein
MKWVWRMRGGMHDWRCEALQTLRAFEAALPRRHRRPLWRAGPTRGSLVVVALLLVLLLVLVLVLALVLLLFGLKDLGARSGSGGEGMRTGGGGG